MSLEVDSHNYDPENLSHLTKEELISIILDLKEQNVKHKKLTRKMKPKRNIDFTNLKDINVYPVSKYNVPDLPNKTGFDQGHPNMFSFEIEYRYHKRHVVFKLLYLGWDYHGFATQENSEKTIEHELFRALTMCCLIKSRQTSNYHRCGRTDKGVSSFSQAISLTVRSNGDDSNELPYCKMLNRILPKDIRIVAWSPVKEDFSARFDCGSRTYKYWFPRGDLDVDLMNQGLQHVIGTHDFRNLCKMDVANGVVQFYRRITRADIKICSENNQFSTNRDYDMCELTIVGKAFLWHQIRCIVSVLILVGSRKENENIFKDLLDIENCPRKPQYCLASDLPLNLFDCQFENVNWVIEDESISEVITSLQCSWATHMIKATMLGEMLKNTETLVENKVNNQSKWLIQGVHSKIYQPLLKRPASASLENRIQYYTKKGKLKLECNEK